MTSSTRASPPWLTAAERMALVGLAAASLLSFFLLQVSAIALAALVLAALALRRPAPTLPSWREPAVPWAGFVLALLAVTLARGAWDGLPQLWPFLTLPCCALALAHTGDRRRREGRAFVLAAVLISLYAAAQSLTGIDVLLIGAKPRPLQTWMGGHLIKADGFFRHHAILAIALLPPWFVALTLFHERRSGWLIAAMAAIGLGILATGSLTGIAGWAIGAGTYVGLRILPRRLELPLLTAAMLLPLALIALSYRLPWVPGSMVARQYIWGVSAEILAETHVIGGGVASFRPRAQALMRDDPSITVRPSYSILTTAAGEQVGVNVKHAHNQFLDILLEGGALALLAFLAFLLALLAVLRRAGPPRRAPLLALAVALVVTFWTDCPFKHHNSLFVLGFALAYSAHLAREPDDAPA